MDAGPVTIATAADITTEDGNDEDCKDGGEEQLKGQKQ